MTTEINTYLKKGCGRCKLFSTPDCKVHLWITELKELRKIALASGLHEEMKWGSPCYTYNGKNIVMIAAFKENCIISFFKGSLLKDQQHILEKAGENSQIARVIRFKKLSEIKTIKKDLEKYIMEAIENEKKGMKSATVNPKENVMPEELIKILKENTTLQKAFFSLTPGRQRGYLLFFFQAKQSATRESRIKKCIPLILNGKGLHD